MKRILKSWALVAAAAMGAVACQKEMQEELPVNGETVQVTFVAGAADTKTSVDASGKAPAFAWGENETFAVLEQTDALAAAASVTYAKVDGKAHITAEFTANPGKESYDYVTIYPASGYVSATGLGAATLSLPAVQTMAEGSYDPNADLMVSEVVSANAQPTEAQMVRFTRMAAVVKMTLKNFTLEEGDQVEQVIFTADGKSLAGTITGDLAAPKEFEVAEGVDNVTVNTTSSTDVYFTVLPTTLEAGDAYTVTVLTNKKIYIKNGAIPAEKSLAFEKGNVTRLGVNMAEVESIDKWILVKDASTLKEGDVVAIVAKDYDMALSKKLYSNGSETATNTRRDAVAISKYQDYLIVNENVQSFTLVTGSAAGTFSFYDEGRAKFLVSNNKTSRYLINQAYVDLNTSFAITIDAESGDATVKNIDGDYKDCMIRYYNSSKYFYSGTSANQAICIYKHGGVTGEIPTVPANVTVPDSDEPVVIAEEGAAEATAISEVVFNYVGDWTITPSTEAQWLNVAYDAAKNRLTYTAEANTGAKREAVVTITASLEGKEDLTWTFNVLQKGAPEEITIAEFMTKGKDENVAYKITGRITEMTSSSSGTFKLTDGTNVATVTYLYTDAGDKVYGDTSIGLEVGDVVTVTTVVTSSTKGKGGSSTYPSIYKGHYGLKASAGVAAEYTSGTVAIEVTTKNNGNIVVPEAVTAVMTENDFAELSYNGGNQATVTFASENTSSEAREAEVTFTYGMTSVVVTVQQGINPANKLGYELVTDASTLAIGDEVIIVALNADKAIACPTSTSATSFPAATISKTGNVIYDVEEAGVQVFTLSAGVSEGTMAFDFTYKDTGYRLYYSSGLKMRATSYAVNAATSWTIDINAADGDATITSTRLIKFNSTGGTTFTAYATTNANATKAENAVAIYKKQK
ncbi:MAG: BACON domain-containing protein [Bacteroidales bacterium]|nr:BACON domain-containing protein [Bacteroidales bacterium]